MLRMLKDLAEHIPEPLGRAAVYVPYSWRLGKQYTKSRAQIAAFAALDPDARQEYLFSRFKHIVLFAARHNPFYREFYRQHGFDPESLQGSEDVERVPIVTKDDLQRVGVEKRTTPGHGRFRINTGGTSGAPLEFYLDSRAWAREWAHNHYIWSKLGYRPTDLKLTFRGKNIGDQPLRYNAVHNEYVVSAYHSFEEIAAAVRKVALRRMIRYFHGYPSIISEFARFCHESDPELVGVMPELRGILLASEFPAPVYRNIIEEVFRVPTLSWYGHSEMSVIAYERSMPFVFEPLPTYGYCEAVRDEAGEFRLVATSFHNTASPFIRYDTGDLVIPEHDRGIVKNFRIASGRVGDFILDRNGRRVSLTALVFGRHHPVFGVARFLQVVQSEPGKARILVTLPSGACSDGIDWSTAFDSSNVVVEFEFVVRREPVRTAAGKVPLLVPESMMSG